MSQEYYARVPFQYGEQNLDRGELITLQGFPRDAQLVGLRYLMEQPRAEKTHRCDMCGKRFANEDFYRQHKAKPDCMSEPKPISRLETAQLLDVDVNRVQI